MLPESPYIKNLRLSLSKSKALTWVRPTTSLKTTRVTQPPKITYSYEELRTILNEEDITDVNQMVRKNIIEEKCTQVLSFVVKGLGLLVYTFEDGITSQLCFVPEYYFQFKQMKKARARLDTSIREFAKLGVIHIYISRLQWVVDRIDQDSLLALESKTTVLG